MLGIYVLRGAGIILGDQLVPRAYASNLVVFSAVLRLDWLRHNGLVCARRAFNRNAAATNCHRTHNGDRVADHSSDSNVHRDSNRHHDRHPATHDHAPTDCDSAVANA